LGAAAGRQSFAGRFAAGGTDPRGLDAVIEGRMRELQPRLR